MISLIGWCGNLFFVFGAYFLAKKHIAGWYCQIFGNLCYLLYALMLGIDGISLFALSVLLTVINYYGLKQWKTSNWIKLKQGISLDTLRRPIEHTKIIKEK